MILDSLVKQNDEFQEKIMEILTGVKAPTKAGGAKKTTPKRAPVSKGAKPTAAPRRAAKPKRPRPIEATISSPIIIIAKPKETSDKPTPSDHSNAG